MEHAAVSYALLRTVSKTALSFLYPVPELEIIQFQPIPLLIYTWNQVYQYFGFGTCKFPAVNLSQSSNIHGEQRPTALVLQSERRRSGSQRDLNALPAPGCDMYDCV